MREVQIVWTDYMKYRMRLRGYNAALVEDIVKYSSERYIDSVTGSYVAIGRYGNDCVMIPYEKGEEHLTPVTIHATSRQQIDFRVKSGRFRNE